MMKQNLDWVGTTERLSNDTMPLLLKMVRFNHSGGIAIDVQSKSKKSKIHFDRPLSEMTKSKLGLLSKCDQVIYDLVKEHYSLGRKEVG